MCVATDCTVAESASCCQEEGDFLPSPASWDGQTQSQHLPHRLEQRQVGLESRPDPSDIVLSGEGGELSGE